MQMKLHKKDLTWNRQKFNNARLIKVDREKMLLIRGIFR